MTDNKEPSAQSVPVLIVRDGQSDAAARLAAGLNDDADVVLVHVKNCRRNTHGKID